MVIRAQLVALAITLAAVAATAIGVQFLGPKNNPASLAVGPSEEIGASSGSSPPIDAAATATASADAAVDEKREAAAATEPSVDSDPGVATSTEPSIVEAGSMPQRRSSTAAGGEEVAQPGQGSAMSQPEVSGAQESILGAELKREQVAEITSEADRATAATEPRWTEADAPGAFRAPEMDTSEVHDDPAADVLGESSATSRSLATAKGEPTARDDLLAIKGPSADSSATDEAAVSASAQAVPASRADETAATARNVETLATDLQGQTGDQLAEPDGVATELMDKSGRDAAIDAEPTASGSSETAEEQEAPGALLASGGSSATAASDAVEPATGPVAADISAPVNLSLVHFDTSSSSLSPGAVMMVDRAAASLEGLSDTFRVEIKGFTDTVGSEAFNLWLAERRVNRVIDALVERGIPRENLIASPRGPFGLPVPTGDNVSEPLNRCVAITLVEAQ